MSSLETDLLVSSSFLHELVKKFKNCFFGDGFRFVSLQMSKVRAFFRVSGEGATSRADSEMCSSATARSPPKDTASNTTGTTFSSTTG